MRLHRRTGASPFIAYFGLLLGAAAFPAQVRPGLIAMEVAGEKEVKVWAIVSSKIYHCPGSRWYGKTQGGQYLGECQALQDGYRPYLGRGCGSTCQNPTASNESTLCGLEPPEPVTHELWRRP